MHPKTKIILSLLGVVLGAVLVNEIVLSSGAPEKDRAVASFGERFEPEQIKWEQELAKTISKDSQAKTVLATKPSSQDRLMFEFFEGRYQATLNEGKINKISLLPNQAPIEFNTISFMKDYGFNLKDFDSFEMNPTKDLQDSVRLKNKSGAVIGLLVIHRDDKGRVLLIEVQ